MTPSIGPLTPLVPTPLRRSGLLLGLALCLARVTLGQSPVIGDPVASFVNGLNPTEEDFFAGSPERTVLLRMRLDLDGDGRTDLALSESSVFGGGGGPWLLFRRLLAKGYRYVGEVFAAPGELRLVRKRSGPELIAGSAMSADVTHLASYRLTADTIVLLAQRDTRGGWPTDTRTVFESCRLSHYRQTPLACWQAGWPDH